MLEFARILSTLGNIYNLNTSAHDASSATVTFAGGLGAQSYQYQLSTTGSADGFGAWASLAATNVIGGLSGSTQYWFRLRGVRGMIYGPMSAPGTVTTDAAGGGTAGEPIGLLLSLTKAS